LANKRTHLQRFKVLSAGVVLFNECSIGLLHGKSNCNLQTVHVYLPFGDFAPKPHRGTGARFTKNPGAFPKYFLRLVLSSSQVSNLGFLSYS